jgi:hypothetical protein
MPKAKSHRSTPTSAKAPASRQHCPAQALMKQATAVQRTRLELMDQHDRDHCDELYDLEQSLLTTASFTRANSFQGALFQAAVLRDVVYVELFQNLPKETADQHLDVVQKAVRLIASIASVLAKAMGDDQAAKQARGVWLDHDALRRVEQALS